MFFVSGGTVLFMLCSAIPVGIAIAICRAHDRRKLRRLMDERNRLGDLRDREGERRVQREISEWTGRLHPRTVKELEQWCAAHPSEEGLARIRAQQDREKWRREDEEWAREQRYKNSRR